MSACRFPGAVPCSGPSPFPEPVCGSFSDLPLLPSPCFFSAPLIVSSAVSFESFALGEPLDIGVAELDSLGLPDAVRLAKRFGLALDVGVGFVVGLWDRFVGVGGVEACLL